MASTLELAASTFAWDPDTTAAGTNKNLIDVNYNSGAEQFTIKSVTGKNAVTTIDGLGLTTTEGLNLDSTSNIRFQTNVTNLSANLGDDGDILAFTGNTSVANSFIQTDLTPTSSTGGADSLSVGGSFTNSTVYTGAGNDTLLFSGGVSQSTIGTNDGNDALRFEAAVTNSKVYTDAGADSLVFSSTVSGTILPTPTPEGISTSSVIGTGTGNDTLTFSGALPNTIMVSNTTIKTDAGNDSIIFSGGYNGGLIDLGSGSDTIVFGTGTYTNYTINLGTTGTGANGADGDIDSVTFTEPITSSSGIQIVGANAGDILVVGGTTYTYQNGEFRNGSDTSMFWIS